jgi:predicted TIM-barrel fold metal-dependent hydrolase
MTDIDLIPVPVERKAPADSWKPPHGIRLISADDHHEEAEHLWEERLPAKWKDKAPKLWRDGHGLHFEAEGRNLMLNNPVEDLLSEVEGFWDNEKRLQVMEAEHIEGSVLFHGRVQALNALQDKELYWACMDVYNEWLAEDLGPHADKLVGVAVLPVFLRPEAARDYMQKLKQLGYRAVQMPASPRGIRYNSRQMDPVWEAVQESGLPLSFHVGAYLEFSGYGSMGANIARNLSPFRPLLGQLMFAGVFERFPELKVVFTEGGASWVATAIADMDFVFRSYYSVLSPKLAQLPSFYWRRQCYASFMADPVALELVERIGADNMLWSTDYPHSEGVFGYAGEVAKEIYDKVGHDHAAKILGGNAAKLWKF